MRRPAHRGKKKLNDSDDADDNKETDHQSCKKSVETERGAHTRWGMQMGLYVCL